ncbi:MAG: hypothetical protein QXF82_03330, partial [Nitrososphaeria archaeon]
NRLKELELIKVISTNPPPPVIINEEIEISRTPVKREGVTSHEDINEKIKEIKDVLNKIERNFLVKAKIKEINLKIKREESSYEYPWRYDVDVIIELSCEDKNEDILENTTLELTRELIELEVNVINVEVNEEKKIAHFTIKL